MKKPLDKTQSARIGYGSILASEVMTLREFGRRLGLGPRALCDAQRQGLRAVLFGRVKYVVGADAIDFFRQLAEQQAVTNSDGGQPDG